MEKKELIKLADKLMLLNDLNKEKIALLKKHIDENLISEISKSN